MNPGHEAVPFTVATTDPAVVDRVLREAGVDHTPFPEASWSGYLEGLLEAVVHKLLEWFHRLPVRDAISRFPRLIPVVAITLGILVTGCLILLIIRALRAWLGGRQGSPRATAAAPGRDLPLSRDAHAWQQELEARLERGELHKALEALWWWFACSAGGPRRILGSCTSRELVAQSGRLELVAPARRLDRFLYGPRAPSLEEVRALKTQLEQTFA